MAGGSDPADLLQRHVPVLRYDSQEPYFADAASEWTDNPGNELRRADGTVIASAHPVGGQAQLSLSFLGPARYANGAAVSADDRIADTSHDYVTQARRCTLSRSTPTASTAIARRAATAGCGWLLVLLLLQRLQPDRTADQNGASRGRLGDDPAPA